MDSIKEKLDLLRNEIKEMGGIIDFDWCGSLLYPYYEHFNDNKLRYRSGSLVAFWGLLREWEDESGFPFYTGTQKYDCHHFDMYLKAFLKYAPKVKRQFPNIYLVIVESLMEFDERERWESEFPNISKELFDAVREELFHAEVIKIDYDVYQKVYQEGRMLY
ncbi:hypothetical protein D0U04_21185 [Bacillus clarus]|uniref:Uncharacterized protein n=1 Tax=Bacillus clarus TaxID=2338372 RepID=A0A090YXB0_9BACI|nr:hypothetical protein [Bacillus clarus]KFN02753.1 hypothetical protein DJ93_3617 [Bacillus clarus]RFT64878.1 hypothetical protein D0U04_21185 [Bacillus clarus]